jgi:hypothetical protein
MEEMYYTNAQCQGVYKMEWFPQPTEKIMMYLIEVGKSNESTTTPRRNLCFQ